MHCAKGHDADEQLRPEEPLRGLIGDEIIAGTLPHMAWRRGGMRYPQLDCSITRVTLAPLPFAAPFRVGGIAGQTHFRSDTGEIDVRRYGIKFAVALVCTLPTAAFAGGDDDLGKVAFANSCSEAVQPQMQRAVALLHSFWWDQSEAAFRDVLQKDPPCTIAVWGIATVRIGNPFGAGPTTADVATARAALALGARTPPKTERERDYIK